MKSQEIKQENQDKKTIQDFGDEWEKFSQKDLKESYLLQIFSVYFRLFPWNLIDNNSVGFDLGCGSGRWAKFVAPKVKKLYCIDPSKKALSVAQENLKGFNNVEFIEGSVDDITLPVNSMDFAYSLGVLHHIPNTRQGIKQCVDLLKPKAPLLLYLYYAFDNKPFWFRQVFKVSNIIRLFISRLPFKVKLPITQIIAVLVYYPLARASLVLEKLGFNTENIPLSAYKNRKLYTMRNDALDRFGTSLEKRFTALQIKTMMEEADLENIKIGDFAPYWCAIGYKKIGGNNETSFGC
jgi:ubiquinone/menaquinone biosynthesis C-methylase UbiE